MPAELRRSVARFGHISLATWLVLMLLTWASVWTFIRLSTEFGVQRAEAEASFAVKVFGEQSQSVIKSIDSTLLTAAYELGRDMQTGGSDPWRLKQLVDAHALSMENLVQIAFVDAQARTIATHIGPDINLTSLPDREHIRVHLDGIVDGLFVGKPVLGRVSGKWSIQLTRAIKDPAGRVLGVVVASLDPFYFERFWDSLSELQDVNVALLGVDGYIRTQSNGLEESLRIAAKEESLLAKIGNMSFGTFELTADLPQLVTFQKFSNIPIYALAFHSRKEIGSFVRKSVTIYTLIGLSFSVVLSLSAFWLHTAVRRARLHQSVSRRAEERLNQAIGAIPDGFLIWDADDQLVARNSAIDQLYPRTASLIKPGILFREFYEAVIRKNDLQKECTSLSTWIGARMGRDNFALRPIETKTRDGRWVEIVERLTPEGGAIMITHDISEAKVREEALRKSKSDLANQADDLKRLASSAQAGEQAKAAFLAAMSHELRTPLNAICGFSQLIEGKHLPPEQREFLETLRSSANHLSSIVNDILDFSRLENGQLRLHFAPSKLIDILKNLEVVAISLIGTKSIHFATKIIGAIPHFVLIDRKRVNQVLFNLVGNAIKFTDSGSITVSVRVDSMDETRVNLHFEIEDSGRGIPQAVRERLFQPFQQGDLSRQLRAAGTGLGLAISKSLISLMGGEIGFESEVGRGSTFYFVLPVISHSAGATLKNAGLGEVYSPSGDLASVTVPPLRVLVVDDSDASRRLASIILKQRGHHVKEASDGLEAVMSAKNESWDLIFMDLEMPEMDGFEATRRIRTDNGPSQRSMIVALTAQAFEAEAQSAREAGVDDIILKPFDLATFHVCLKSAWERRRELGSSGTATHESALLRPLDG